MNDDRQATFTAQTGVSRAITAKAHGSRTMRLIPCAATAIIFGILNVTKCTQCKSSSEDRTAIVVPDQTLLPTIIVGSSDSDSDETLVRKESVLAALRAGIPIKLKPKTIRKPESLQSAIHAASIEDDIDEVLVRQESAAAAKKACANIQPSSEIEKESLIPSHKSCIKPFVPTKTQSIGQTLIANSLTVPSDSRT